MMMAISRFLRRFRRADDGNATVEFVLVFPVFMVLFISAFEAGLMMTRHVMLERGLDMAVREVRLNTGAAPTHDQFKTMICQGAGIIPNCMENLKLEMRPIDPRNWSNIPSVADCVNTDEPFQAPRNYQTGAPNQIMIVRACSLFLPIFPGTGLGFQMPRQSGDFYALVSMSAFVMEPI
tara:strand:+ start:292 stop:828 length:537 start_codon:yes stop_codon:yes gene_type:complete